MRSWLFWAGASFIIGGLVSLGLNLSVEGELSMLEDLTGYAVGWMVVGVVFIGYSMIKKNKRDHEIS